MANDNKKMTPDMLSTLIGLPLTIGTQIPRLARGTAEEQRLRDIQRRGGAGALAARTSADQAARDAAAVAGAGNAANRGLNLLTGLRSAEQTRQAGAEQASRVAAHEGGQATQLLNSRDLARRAAIGQLGAGIGGSLAAFGAMKQAAADKSAEAAEADAERNQELELALVNAGWTPEQIDAYLGSGEAPVSDEQEAFNEEQRIRSTIDALQEAQTPIGEGRLDESIQRDESMQRPEEEYTGPGLDDLEQLMAPPAPAAPPPLSFDQPDGGGPLTGPEQTAPAPTSAQQVDPIEQERVSVNRALEQTLTSPGMALAIASGITPEAYLRANQPKLLQRKLALDLMLQNGGK